MSETSTPFAAMLRAWMAQQHPPMVQATQLASYLGISRKTVWQWLNGSTVPRPAAFIHIAQKTGIPAEDLLRAAGYDYQPTQVPPQVLESVWHYLDAFAAADHDVSPDTARELRDVIQRAHQQWLREQGASYAVAPAEPPAAAAAAPESHTPPEGVATGQP